MTHPIRPTLTPGRDRWPLLVKGDKTFCGPLALGNGTQYNVACFIKPNGEIFIGVENRGAYSFGGIVDKYYVADKLGLARYPGDAANLADFINRQTSLDECEEVGVYQPSFCRKEPV